MAVISEIKDLGQHVGDVVAIRSWVQATRVHGKVAFVVVRDGTGIVQCVLVQKQVAPEIWGLLESLTLESSVLVTGSVRAEPRAPGGYEIGLENVELIGPSNEYPIQAKEHGVDFLL